MTSKTNKRNLTLRMAERNLAAITRAADVQGVSVEEFMLASAKERAARLLAEHGRVALDAKQWRAFVARLDRPARKLPRLRRLFQEPTVLDVR